MENTPKENTNPAPNIADAELKMPEEEFGASRKDTTHPLIPILAGLLVILVIALSALYYFKDTILETLGMSTPEEPELLEAPDPELEALTSDIDSIEAELEATNFAEIETGLNTIDAEFEVSATSTATTTASTTE